MWRPKHGSHESQAGTGQLAVQATASIFKGRSPCYFEIDTGRKHECVWLDSISQARQGTRRAQSYLISKDKRGDWSVEQRRGDALAFGPGKA